MSVGAYNTFVISIQRRISSFYSYVKIVDFSGAQSFLSFGFIHFQTNVKNCLYECSDRKNYV